MVNADRFVVSNVNGFLSGSVIGFQEQGTNNSLTLIDDSVLMDDINGFQDAALLKSEALLKSPTMFSNVPADALLYVVA